MLRFPVCQHGRVIPVLLCPVLSCCVLLPSCFLLFCLVLYLFAFWTFWSCNREAHPAKTKMAIQTRTEVKVSLSPARNASPSNEIETSNRVILSPHVVLGEAFIVGAKVEARYGGGPKFYPGTVTSINSEGRLTQCILFSLWCTSSDGLHVFLFFGFWFSGKVLSMSIKYEDGEDESNVPRIRIRLPGQKQPKVLTKGEKVEARFGGKRYFYPAIVLSVKPYPTPPARLILFHSLQNACANSFFFWEVTYIPLL